MSLEFRPYTPGDLLAVRLPNRETVKIEPRDEQGLAASSWAFTCLKDGVTLGCGGFIRADAWRALAWAIFAAKIAPREWVAIRARCELQMTLLEADGVHLIEAEVARGFAGGHAFARSLGFRFVGVIPGRMADGGLFVRYARTTGAAEWPTARVRALLDLTERTLADSLIREAA